VTEEEDAFIILWKILQISESALRDGEKCHTKDHALGHPKDFFPWVDEGRRG
jgi:hypothetical protein